MAQSSVIETGVDKLVALIKQNKRISVPDAAKLLNVSRVVIEEWADFLEEEGIISIEYKFTTPYLVDRVLSKKEVEEKIKEFKGKKEGFVRKAEVALSLLDEKGEVFGKLREDFKKLKDELGKDLQSVQEELKLLEQYNNEKRDIDNQVRQQENIFKEKIAQMEAQIAKERQRFAEILTDIKSQEDVLGKEKVKALSMRETIKAAEDSVDKYEKTVSDIKSRLGSEEHTIKDVEQHLERLKGSADSERKDVEQKNRQMQELMQKSQEQERKIVELQENIIKKTLSKNKVITRGAEAGKNSATKLKRFMANYDKIEKYLTKINADRDHLRQELDELIKKARTVNLISKATDVKNVLPDLQKKFVQVEKDKSSFEKEVGKLKSIIRL
jgi:chromosome segregation ATPase